MPACASGRSRPSSVRQREVRARDGWSLVSLQTKKLDSVVKLLIQFFNKSKQTYSIIIILCLIRMHVNYTTLH